MAKNGVYGIEKFLLKDAVSGAFPDFTTGAYSLKAIVKDSLSYNDQAASENDIEVEDMDSFYATLESTKATKGFTIQTYDMGEETYQHLCGYAKNEETGYYEETPGFVLGNQAVQLTTKALDEFPAKVFEWANMKVTVTRTGTIGKSGFPNFNLEFKQQALTDDDGEEIPGARWKLAE